jgi:peptide/nickel transport system ATP-binding protein
MIKIQHLTITFTVKRVALDAVKDVSFHVNEGESYGLVGESGSGKSTILRTIMGLNRSWTGEIYINGEKQGLAKNKSFYERIQMVFQDPYGSLHPRHTVDRILSEPLAIHNLPKTNRVVEEMLTQVGLDARFRFRFPHQLSGGQRQRVAIARALILNPKILLLDEPTSALDVSIQAEALNLLNRLKTEHQLTFIFVSHNLPVIAQMCDRIGVMNRGRLIEELTVDSMLQANIAHPYTRQLLLASQGYNRSLIDNFREFHNE